MLWEVLPRVVREIGSLRGVLQRVLREIGGAPGSALEGAPPVDDHRRSTLESTPWSTPNFPEHPLEHPPPSTPISLSTLGSTSQSTFREFPTLAPL